MKIERGNTLEMGLARDYATNPSLTSTLAYLLLPCLSCSPPSQPGVTRPTPTLLVSLDSHWLQVWTEPLIQVPDVSYITAWDLGGG